MKGIVPLCLVVLSSGCEEKKSAAPPAPPPPQATSSVAATSVPKEATPPGTTRFSMVMGKASFLIDAPLEKIKGASDELRGSLDINPKDLNASRGAIMVRLSSLKTQTFGEMEKDAAQTEHARNWMEVGPESSADARMKYEWATFTIATIVATPTSLSDAKEENGARVIKAKASGDLSIHGKTSTKTVPVTVTFKGPPDAPTDVAIKTDEPMRVSMKEHGVMPRDAVGGFLNGALERIGKKIDDNVQVSFEATAKGAMPDHP